MKDEALRQALEFVETNHAGGPDAFELINTIKQALEQPEPEPVALRFRFPHGKQWHYTEYGPHEQSRAELTWQNLYTSPPKRKPLTDDELKPICDEYRILFGYWVNDFARAIEAKLKEKNNVS